MATPRRSEAERAPNPTRDGGAPAIDIDINGTTLTVGEARFDLRQRDELVAAARAVQGAARAGGVGLAVTRATPYRFVTGTLADIRRAQAQRMVLLRTSYGETTHVGRSELLFVSLAPDALRPCTTVGLASNGRAVDLWSAGGSTVTRFTDVGSGSQAMAQRALACDAELIVVEADPSDHWAGAVDFALDTVGAIRAADDKTSRGRFVAFIESPTTPGRPVKLDTP